ncbi:MAG: hypothetical protein QF554_11285 [Dehalococcoidia bacterium]|jgi:hypothetical protein|nr:hypothetical protein [Dehalococcoidia bacterium]
MAFDLDQLYEDAQAAAGAYGGYVGLLGRYMNARTEEGVNLTASQKTAILAAAVARSDAGYAAAAAIKAQHDANP